jgi:hypothetical protein
MTTLSPDDKSFDIQVMECVRGIKDHEVGFFAALILLERARRWYAPEVGMTNDGFYEWLDVSLKALTVLSDKELI